MPFYRVGEPGRDALVHLNLARKATPDSCRVARFPTDDPKLGERCGRMSIALCDAPGCDMPICEGHRTKHTSRANTDFCPEHKGLAEGAVK